MHAPLVIIAMFLAIAAVSAKPLPVRVLDNDNLQPIKGAFLYDNEGGIDSTSAHGRVVLRELKEEATVLFKHRLYKSKELTFAELRKKRTVTLVPVEESRPASRTDADRVADTFPGRMLALGKENSALFNPRSTADLLAASDEIYIQKNNQAGGCPLYRGFTGNSLAFTIDGVRMNNAIFRSDNPQNLMSLDPNVLEGVDVLPGASSTLFGSGAMGGAFNFRFREPGISPDAVFTKTGSAMGRFTLANMEKTGVADVMVSGKNIGSYTAVSFSSAGDLRMGTDSMPLLGLRSGDYFDFYKQKTYIKERLDPVTNTFIDTMPVNPDPAVQKNTGYTTFAVLEKLRMAISDAAVLKGSLYFSATGEVPRYDKSIASLGVPFSEWYYGPQRWLLGSVGLDYSKPNRFFTSLKTTLAYQHFEQRCNTRLYNTSVLTDTTDMVDEFSGTVDLTLPIGERSTLSYGIETSYSTVDATAKSENIVTGQTAYAETRYPSGGNDQLSGSLYSYCKTRWSPIVTSIAGARYGRVYLHSVQGDTLFKSPEREATINTGAPSGWLGVIVQPVDFWRVTLNGSSGYRLPGVDDMNRIFKVVPSTWLIRVPNNDLGPEYTYTVDFGNALALGRQINLDASLFMTKVQDLMVEDRFNYNGQSSVTYNGVSYPVFSIVNSGSATISGGTVNLAVRFLSNLSLENTVTFTSGLVDLVNEESPLYAVPPLFGATHLFFKVHRVRGDFYVRYNGSKIKGPLATDMVVSGDQLFLYPKKGNDLFSPSWYTLNLATTIILTKSVDANVAVENILNRSYRPYANGIAAPGANLSVSVWGRL